jgi:small conductance mechanosensitive channel
MSAASTDDPKQRAVLARAQFPRLLQALARRSYRLVGPTVREAAIVYDEIQSVEDLPRGWTDEQNGGTYRLKRRGDEALFGYVVGPHSWKKCLHPPVQRLWTAKRDGNGFHVEEDSQTSVKQAQRMMNSGTANIPARDWHGSLRQSAGDLSKLLRRVTWLAAVFGVLIVTVRAQEPPLKAGASPAPAPAKEDLSLAPAKVDVNPVARDEEIRQRLQSVLDATEWFTAPEVRVEEGVVFLKGRVASDELKKWAGDLARNTQDVVAVVNRMEVAVPSIWDWGPAWSGLMGLWRDFLRSLPLLFFGLLILGLSVGAGLLAARKGRSLLRHRIQARLLRNVIAGGIGVLVFLVGTYIVLRVSGMTQLALTVVGGTGLVGLAVGIAFRDITENFLASIFLSMQRPFETGDLVEVAGVTGYVQQLNVRTTILMNLDGNLVQIPNASVYKSNLCNFTTNANRRAHFDVGIGYDDSITEAQDIALQVLTDHPAVLSEPEPLVLTDSLGKATVNLRVYFWFNGREHSWLKVRSSVIRLVKRAFQKHGISMPDEAREVVFPQGIPITMRDGKPAGTPAAPADKQLPSARPSEELDVVSTKAEGGLQSEAGVLDVQARQAQPLREGENLLPKAPASSSPEEPAHRSPAKTRTSR